MNCPHCGAPLAENATICESCYNLVPPPQQEPPRLSVPTKPNGSPLGKHEYLLKAAPAKVKLTTKILLAVALACVLVIVLAANTVLNGDFTNIAIIDLAVDDEEMEAFEEQREETLELIEELREEDDDDLYEEFEDEFGFDVDEVEKYVKTLSLNSIVKIMEIQDEDEEVIEILEVLISLVTIGAVISVAMVVLGTLFGQTWLVVLNYIFSILYFLLAPGVVYFVIASVVYIALAVLLSKQNKAYKAYKMVVLAAK